MNHKSEIDASYVIKNEQWVISLVKKDNSFFEEHAFLILEGMGEEENAHKTWFFDFVGGAPGQLLPNAKFGRVRLYEAGDNSKTLLFECPLRMMDLRSNDKIYCSTWYINADRALLLIESIKSEKERTKKQQVPFCILGADSKLTTGSAKSSNKEIGHNCFTWAKKQLKSCDINITPNSTAKWMNSNIISSTGLNLGKAPSEYINFSFFKKSLAVVVAVAAVGAAGIYSLKNE